MGYSKITLSALYSENSNYHAPVAEVAPTEQIGTPTSYYHQRMVVPPGRADTPGAVLDLSANYLNLAAPTAIMIANKDAATTVTVEYWAKLNDLPHPAAGITWTAAGTEGIIEDLTAGGTLFEDVHIGDVVFSANAGNAENRKFYLVKELPQGGAANDWPKRVIVSLYGTSMVSQVADDTASFVHGNRCTAKVPPGSSMYIPGGTMDVDLRTITGTSTLDTQYNEIQLYGDDATAVAEIFMVGA